MIIKQCTIAKSLNKAFLKQDITENEFKRFKNALASFFHSIKHEESEEYQKNTIAEFLKSAFYKDKNLINTSDRIDLAIYNGNSKDSQVSVLMEVKRTSNKNEMFTLSKPNVKSFHEIISYYLEQSLTLRNKEIKHLIITNTEDWFIFDGAEFEKAFYKNTYLTKKFSEHREELFGANTTQWFYNFLRDDIIPKISELNCTYFNINEFEKILNVPEKEEELIELFKILSPEHLLKKPFANDSNTLDSQFYDELLHLIGLDETKESGKKVLLRLPSDKRNAGSLLENTIHHLKQKNALENLDNLNDFGKDEDEQYFSVGLELCITWLNRILFLKLLESQLIKYNESFDYKFLSSEKVTEFDDLNELFFDVLALKPQEREIENKERYKNIPYLNSSLFDMTPLERRTVLISNLKDKHNVPVYGKTVLKTISGDRITGTLKLHKYILDFLDAYNFSSDRKASVQAVSKTIINSSVLGLIFEKLNGYKDGSYFTPSYITMYMCREAITKAVISKFNSHYNWNCNSLDDIYNKLDSSAEKLKEYNNVINSIRLVDPAVGSGHFLVSALNEFIHIKSELGILIDASGKRLRDYKFYIENDELIIVDNDDKIFTYISPDIAAGAKRDELQRVQQTIFHEKQTIIENCLFGVDINPKSVAISRLRLWIELLKSAYYKMNFDSSPSNKREPEGVYELEVLPNIDINIKEGNSLISRFPVDDNSPISRADAKIIPLYKKAVLKYKNIKDSKDKNALKKEIEDYKSQLRGMIVSKSVKTIQLSDLKGTLKSLIDQTDLFQIHKSKKDENEFTKKVNTLTAQIQKLENEVEDIKNNPVYHNAFEWRFEFPEVLDDAGNFIGFDVVIGNPPYGVKYGSIEKSIYLNNYITTNTMEVIENNELLRLKGSLDTFSIFIEKGMQILRNNSQFSFIVPLAITSSDSMTALHNQILKKCETISISTYSNRPKQIFDNADQRVAIISFTKNNIPTKFLLTTKVNKRYENTTIEQLIRNLSFVNSIDYIKYGRLPKVGTNIEINILKKLFRITNNIKAMIKDEGSPIYYRAAGGRYYNIITNFSTHSSAEKYFKVNEIFQNIIAAVLSSNLFYWFYHIYSDTLNMKLYELEIMPIPIEQLMINKNIIENIYLDYLKDLEINSIIQKVNYSNISEMKIYFARKSKHLIDQIDYAIQEAYGFTDEEINFIINYDIKFRTDEAE